MWRIFRRIMSVPHNTILDLNNVMERKKKEINTPLKEKIDICVYKNYEITRHPRYQKFNGLQT